MKKINTMHLAPGIILLFTVIFIGCQFSTANIEKASLCKRVNEKKEPMNETSQFTVEDYVIHCAVHIVNAPSGTKVRAVWYQIMPDKKQSEITKTDITVDEDSWVDFSLTSSTPAFPPSDYAVEIYLNEKKEQTLAYTITAPTANPLLEDATLGYKNASEEFNAASTFPMNIDKIYAQFTLSKLSAPTPMNAKWYAYDDETGTRKEVISTDYTPEENGVHYFTLSPNNTLAKGRYSVQISVNGTLSNVMLFMME